MGELIDFFANQFLTDVMGELIDFSLIESVQRFSVQIGKTSNFVDLLGCCLFHQSLSIIADARCPTM